MKKYFIFILALMLVLTSGCSLTPDSENKKSTTAVAVQSTTENTIKAETLKKDLPTLFNLNMMPVCIDGVWGYMNKSGKLVIPAKYQLAYGFDADSKLALICINSKYGYINTAGELIIDAIYEDGFSFSNGYASVKINGKYGYIDQNGAMEITAKYDYASSFGSNGLACVSENGKYGYIKNNGSYAIPAEYSFANDFDANGFAVVKTENGYGIINASNEMLSNDNYEYIDSTLQQYYVMSSKGFFGMVEPSPDKTVILEASYDKMGLFSDGLVPVCIQDSWCYLNINGEKAFPQTFQDAKHFNGSLAPVESDGMWGLINSKGEFIVKAEYEKISPLSVPNLFGVKKDGVWGILNSDNEVIVKPRFEDIFTDFYSDGYAVVKHNGKLAVIDSTGKTIIKPSFDNTIIDNIFV